MKTNPWRNAISRLFEKPQESRGPETITLGVQRMEERQVLSASGGEVMLFSVGGAGINLPNGQHADAEDVVQFDGSEFEILFDGSTIQDDNQPLLAGDIDALAYIGDDQFLFSFAAATTIDGVTYGSSDIVLFQADSFGEGTTSGTFSLFVSGQSLNLNSTAGNIDALDLLDDGSLIISTAGDVTPLSGGETYRDEDLIQITPDASGNYTVQNMSLFFKGNCVGLNFPSEDIDAVSVDGLLIRLSTDGGFFIDGQSLSGSQEDVLSFTTSSLGEETAGTFAITFDGSAYFGGFDLDALDFGVIREPTNPPTAGDVSVALDEDIPAQGQLLGDDGDPDLDQALTYEIVDGPDFGVITGFDAGTGTFTYVPNADYHGSDSFTYLVHDVDADGVALTSGIATVNLTINSINDAPTVHLAETQFAGNQGESVVIQGISVGDLEAESGNAPVTVVLTAENGILALAEVSTPAQISGNGTGEITIHGTVADINALLASGVTYTPAADVFGQAAVNVTIQDEADPATSLEASGTVQIDIAEVVPVDPEQAFQERISELARSGELRRGIAQSLLNTIRGNNIRRINGGLQRIVWLERLGRLDSDTADELRGYLNDLKEDIAEAANRGPDASFAQFGRGNAIATLARLKGGRR